MQLRKHISTIISARSALYYSRSLVDYLVIHKQLIVIKYTASNVRRNLIVMISFMSIFGEVASLLRNLVIRISLSRRRG